MKSFEIYKMGLMTYSDVNLYRFKKIRWPIYMILDLKNTKDMLLNFD